MTSFEHVVTMLLKRLMYHLHISLEGNKLSRLANGGYITAYKKPDKKKQLTLTGIKACNHQDNTTMQEKRKYPFRKTQRIHLNHLVTPIVLR